MRNGLYTLLLSAVYGLVMATIPARTAPAAGTTCTRPAGNTGTGFYVGCGRVNNANGSEYRVRGVVRSHFDVAAAPSIANTKANVVRTYYPYETGTTAQFRADFQSLQSRGLTPVASLDSYSGTLSSCRTEPGRLASQVARWVRDASVWTLLNAQGMIDLSSEWGPASPSVWRDQLVSAIRTLRAAGYTMPLMIDSGTCSRRQADFTARAAEIAGADPQHNVIFWMRLDGATPSSATLHTQVASLASLSAADPQLAFVTGIFGPGSNLPPAPVVLTPDDMIQTSETNSLGWMAWTWDGSNQSGCVADNNSTSLLANPCSGYSGQSTQLTNYGQDVLAQLALYATGGQPLSAPPEAVQSGYTVNTYSVTNFNAPMTLDTTNSKSAGYKLYPYNLVGAVPPLNDFQFNADGSLTLLGASTGPNGELVSATPINGNKAFHGTAFGGGGLIEATLQFAAGNYTKANAGGFPSWWAQPLETSVIYGAAGADQWPGQATGYHMSVEMDIMEYIGQSTSPIMGGSLHVSYGMYKVTCAPTAYCVYNSSLPLWTQPDLSQPHRYGWRWTPATATSNGKAEFLLDGTVKSSQAWSQFTGQAPPPAATWAFGMVDSLHYVLILGTGPGAPVRVLAINAWQKDATQNRVN